MSKSTSNSTPNNDLFSMDLLGGGDQPPATLVQSNPIMNSMPIMDSNPGDLLDNNKGQDLLGENMNDSNKHKDSFDFDDFEEPAPKQEQFVLKIVAMSTDHVDINFEVTKVTKIL